VIPGGVLPEIILLMGEVPAVPYTSTGTPALGEVARSVGRVCPGSPEN